MLPIPADEADRLQYLLSYPLNTRPVEGELDELAALAADLYKTPIALVTLVTEFDQVIHGRTGLQLDSTPRAVSFCAHVIAGDGPLIVHDAATDPRFAHNPLVTGEPHIRFYAGAPIVTQTGVRLGAICVIDRVPHPGFAAADTRQLVQLAGLAARRIEDRRYEATGRAVSGFADATALAILTADPDGIITFWNTAAEQLFGFPRADAIGRSIDIIVPARFQDAHNAGLSRMKQGGKTRLVGKTVEVIACRADGHEVPIELSLSAWPTASGVALGAHAQDISIRREREAKLEHLAAHDQLTGLLNPHCFRERIRQRIEAEESAAVLSFDLDGFKVINDTLGHAVGDALLQCLAVRLRSVCGPDWGIGRLGGDEFAILLPGGDLFGARDAANAVLASFFDPFEVDGHQLQLTASIGIALTPSHSTDAEELLTLADLAMFRVKRSGGGRHRLFDSSMRAELAARRAYSDELCQAQVSGQWVLHYQPQVCLADGTLTGVEALLRWRHPQWGMLAPAAFMSILETHLAASKVGLWVLDESCRQLAAWRQGGLKVPRVSCNLFGVQVHGRGLFGQVENALEKHDLRPSDLELEITETIALRHDDETLRPLFKLVEWGVGVALDDFGTGFASLSTLKRTPLTRLKIDRSFVADVCTDQHSAAVIGGIMSIGNALGIDVIAEGIETLEQEAALMARGCTQAQGYLYGHPVGGDELAVALTHQASGRAAPRLVGL